MGAEFGVELGRWGLVSPLGWNVLQEMRKHRSLLPKRAWLQHGGAPVVPTMDAPRVYGASADAVAVCCGRPTGARRRGVAVLPARGKHLLAFSCYWMS